jgi:hypothetical protein
MLDQAETDELRARIADVESRRVPLGEIVRWFEPWILAGALVLVFLGGLWCASSAADDGTYAIGLAAAALALAALIWELGAAFRGDVGNVARRLLVDDEEALVVLLALLSALALGGLVFAARAASVAVSGAGYGLCVVAIVFIFANLKHYFDRRDGRP